VDNADRSPTPIITALAAMAAQAHELFTSMQAAGFTEEQAMTLVIGMMRGGDQ